MITIWVRRFLKGHTNLDYCMIPDWDVLELFYIDLSLNLALSTSWIYLSFSIGSPSTGKSFFASLTFTRDSALSYSITSRCSDTVPITLANYYAPPLAVLSQWCRRIFRHIPRMTSICIFPLPTHPALHLLHFFYRLPHYKGLYLPESFKEWAIVEKTRGFLFQSSLEILETFMWPISQADE